jgi:GT2 family glycosyltransferase
MNQRLTISLLTYNSEKYLNKSLLALSQQSEPASIIVTDNNSSDNSVPLIKEYLPQAKLICNRQNIGFCKAHNRVISWCQTPYILILNPDVLLEKDFCQTLANFLDNNSNYAAVSGVLRRWEQNENNNENHIIDTAGLRLQKNGQVYDINMLPDNEKTEVFGLSGAVVMYRLSALKKVCLISSKGEQYFDESYFLYKEDVDLAFRLRIAGFQSATLNNAIGFHKRSLSGWFSLKKRLQMEIARSSSLAEYSFVNHYKTLIKNLPSTDCKRMFVPIIITAFCRWLITLFIKPMVALTVAYKLTVSLPILLKQRKYIQGKIKTIKSLSDWYNN